MLKDQHGFPFRESTLLLQPSYCSLLLFGCYTVGQEGFYPILIDGSSGQDRSIVNVLLLIFKIGFPVIGSVNGENFKDLNYFRSVIKPSGIDR